MMSVREATKPVTRRRLLRTKEAAEYLAVSQWKLRQIAGVKLPYLAEGDGMPWRFDVRDLDAYIEEHKQRV